MAKTGHGDHGKHRIQPLWEAADKQSAIYARVYEDGHIDIVGRNVKLDISQGAHGKGSTQRWAFGDNWHVDGKPWEASQGDGETFQPPEGE